MALEVTVQEVAEYAPDAPAVTAVQILEAQDWAEPQLERAGVVLVAGTRAERAARRAVMNYALHLRVGMGASSLRATVTGAAVTQERKKVGDLETEKRYAQPTDTAAGYLTSASEYLARAWTALHDAGVPRRAPAVGASR